MEALTRSVWQGLSEQDKQEWMQRIVLQLPEGMQYEGLQTFERYGQRTQTGVFTHDEQRFVFVPGDQVTLGWEKWHHGMDEQTTADLHETASSYGIEDVQSFLAGQMSPVRAVNIGPMLVECETTSLGWIEVTEEEAFAQEHDDFPKALAEFKESGLNEYELHLEFKLIQDQGEVRILWFNEGIELEDIVKEETAAGFSLLTEDEWEYIYGGGCRTLFPWGDSFDYTMRLRHLGIPQNQDRLDQSFVHSEKDTDTAVDTGTDALTEPTESSRAGANHHQYDLELPNFFGIQFTGDPYKYELTLGADDEVMPKGGDGGALICGGTGPLLSFLPAASVFFRDMNVDELDWEELMDALYYRRVIRLRDVKINGE
ncbi:formylglycine-generating enzyme family protein [Paenibacillus xylanexedens]|uniref:formylglycine-generating enzyme family protein n=1 Tax=Paenibacillus xylanexedens TaxID=528191 RepID=UPI00119CADF5|nr:formylglycine-generating enzyme family protein [Paenibacillus xylanexedens]